MVWPFDDSGSRSVRCAMQTSATDRRRRRMPASRELGAPTWHWRTCRARGPPRSARLLRAKTLLGGAQIFGHRRAGADQVAVAGDIVDARHRRPVFGRSVGIACRIGRLQPRIGVGPVGGQSFGCGMRRVDQRIVVLRPFAACDALAPPGRWRSSPRRSGRSLRAAPIPSVRPSASRPPATTWSAHESHSRSGAWRRPPR